jgi:hypothetical protein
VALPVHHKLLYALVGAAATVCAIGAFGLVAFLMDDSDLRVVLARIRQFVRPRSLRQRAD